MRIGQLAQRTGLSRDTIRYYERRGLLSPRRDDSGNDYRRYTEADVDTLYLVAEAKRLGMTLRQISAHLTRFVAGEMKSEELCELFGGQLAEVRKRQVELAAYEAYLVDKLAKAQSGWDATDFLRDLAEPCDD